MSVVVAMKRNGGVYMGADTLACRGDRKQSQRCDKDYKIHVTEEGLLVGITGNVAVAQRLLFSDAFQLDKKKLTKSYVVKEMLPKIIMLLDRGGLWEEKEGNDLDMGVSILLAHEDKLFYVSSSLATVEMNGFGCIGSGEDYAAPILSLGYHRGDDVKETLLKAMRMSAKFSSSVGAPYVLINTQGLKFTVEEV